MSLDVQDSGVAVLTLDRPPANGLSLGAREKLGEMWVRIGDDESISSVVVTGSGERFFSAGLDMFELAGWHETHTASERHQLIDVLAWDPWRAALDKPVIAAINGYCLAGGMYLALMCDIRIASSHARFGIPEVKWSHPAVFTWMLARQLPLNLVTEMTLWADRTFSASRMHEIGFLNEVVKPEALMSTAIGWAREVAAMPTEAVRTHKRILHRAVFGDFEAAQRSAESLAASLHELPDSTERLSLFFGDRDSQAVDP